MNILTREMEDIKKNYMKLLELKNVSDMKNCMELIADQTLEKIITELKYMAVEKTFIYNSRKYSCSGKKRKKD